MIGAILLCSLLTPWKVFHHKIPGFQSALKSIKMTIKLKHDKKQHKGYKLIMKSHFLPMHWHFI
jgi:hypothetical protein